MKISMSVPLVMTWFFEKNYVRMKKVTEEVGEVLVWYETQSAAGGGGGGGSGGGGEVERLAKGARPLTEDIIRTHLNQLSDTIVRRLPLFIQKESPSVVSRQSEEDEKLFAAAPLGDDAEWTVDALGRLEDVGIWMPGFVRLRESQPCTAFGSWSGR